MRNKKLIFSIALLITTFAGIAFAEEDTTKEIACPDPAVFDHMCKDFRDGDYPQVDAIIGPWHLIVNCNLYDKGYHAVNKEVKDHIAHINVYINNDQVVACHYGPAIDGIFTPGAWIPHGGAIKSATKVEKAENTNWGTLSGGGYICGPEYSPNKKTQMSQCKFILNK